MTIVPVAQYHFSSESKFYELFSFLYFTEGPVPFLQNNIKMVSSSYNVSIQGPSELVEDFKKSEGLPGPNDFQATQT